MIAAPPTRCGISLAATMGASNVIAAYRKYAGVVPHPSMVLLAYMAAVSIDADAEPWYGEGHEALARMALGRGRHAKLERKDIKAVERAIQPLRDCGAITTDRPAASRASGPSTVRYRLHLKLASSAHMPEKSVGNPVESVVETPVDNSSKIDNVPREMDTTSPAKRPDVPRETGDRGTTRSENYKEEEKTSVRTSPFDAREAAQDPIFLATPPEPPPPKPGGMRTDPLTALMAGLGFCATCYAAGHTVIATDPDNGNACTYHALAARRIRWNELDTGQRKIIIPESA